MITVVDQHKPWLTPSRTLANTIQPQLGAQMMSSGTGSPASQPATRSGLRPIRAASWPANRLASALTMRKLTRKDRTTVFETSPKSAWAMSGTTVRASPTMAPTKALTTTSSVNGRQLAPRPSRMGDGVSGNGAAIGACLQLSGVVGKRAGFVQGDDAVMVRGSRRDPGEDVPHKRLLALAQEREPFSDFPERRADWPTVKGHRLARMGRQDDSIVRQRDQAMQGRVEQVGPAARLLRGCLEIGTAHGGQEQRVAGEQGTVVQQIAGAFGGMARRAQRPELGGSHSYGVVVLQRRVLEGDAIRRGKTKHRPSGGCKSPGAGQVVGVHVRFKNGADVPAVCVGHALVHLGIERRIDHSGSAVRADEIGEASLPSAAQLHDPCSASATRTLGRVPGQAPGAHPALE